VKFVRDLDRFGNRWQQNGPQSMQLSFTGNATTNNNRMDGYKYDSAGNLLNDGVHNYFYDAENHLIQTDGTLGVCSSATSCYAYDPEGNRVQKINNVSGSYGDPAGTFQFTYDQQGRLMEKSDGTMWQGEIYIGLLQFLRFLNPLCYPRVFNSLVFGLALRFSRAALVEPDKGVVILLFVHGFHKVRRYA
jgi:hypothetical protein